MSKRHFGGGDADSPRLENKRARFTELPTGSSVGPSAPRGRSRSLGPHCNVARNERLRNRAYMSEPPLRVISQPLPAAQSEANLQNQEQGDQLHDVEAAGDTAQEVLEGIDVNESNSSSDEPNDPDL